MKVKWFYWLIAAFFLTVGLLVLRDRSNPHRVWSGVFWSLLGLCFSYSAFVVVKRCQLAARAGCGGDRLHRRVRPARPRQPGEDHQPRERWALSECFGNKLFLPVLVIPVITGLFATFGKDVKIGGRPVLQPLNETVIGLGVSAIVAVLVGMWLLRTLNAAVPLHRSAPADREQWLGSRSPPAARHARPCVRHRRRRQGHRRLGQARPAQGVPSRGSCPLLPGVGRVHSHHGQCLRHVPGHDGRHRLSAPDPELRWHSGHRVRDRHAVGLLRDPVHALAANFNIVPVALLELKSDDAVIRQQVPTAVPLWACNVALMYFLTLRRSTA